ncbi:phytoene desaturase family protein [Paludisphaera rhizosphaerae]|uniref:phytoene desaturase family protein n=1 Tax=Paludisphaera rhizosphaerae TaxID=2711216 RepID=UPI0013EC2004|nr:NAD(P)/FAD-dependent oxidoreductase [Paludisphaera rhizosphaerae]
MYDVAVVGGGLAGMATAARLQARGLSTVVLEGHGQPGGCAGFYRRAGFSFDVGATTLVDFGPGGLGGELLADLGVDPEIEMLPGYVAWLPDRRVTLHRDASAWAVERMRAFGDTPAHRAFWGLIDRLAEVFWRASRNGVKLPFQNPADVFRAVRTIGLRDLFLARHLNRTMADALRSAGLRKDKPLAGMLGMLVEDTVHSTLEDAPLINAALGVTMRGAGIGRARGGMRGFWRRLTARYRELGGEIRVGRAVERVDGREGSFHIQTRRDHLTAARVVMAVPPPIAAKIGPPELNEALKPHLRRNADAMGGAMVVFLGVPEREVDGQTFTHHQLMQDYDQPLGNGNNMFMSVSSPGDVESAPAGFRAVMISTHCELSPWEGLSPEDYAARKREAGDRLLTLARRVFPNLGQSAVVYEVGTPRTYARFTGRPRGAVGGSKLTPSIANQNAIPHDVGVPGIRLVGDGVWPGLGTVACCLGAKIVAEQLLQSKGWDSRRAMRRGLQNERQERGRLGGTMAGTTTGG